MKARTKVFLFTLFAAVLGGTAYLGLVASDHDDGESDLKGRALNLTDLYVFREDWQAGTGSDNLIVMMNSNPRSLARQQYYFSTKARYEFHLSRVSAKDIRPLEPKDDVLLRFEFGEPDSNSRQDITLTAVKDGRETPVSAGLTTSLADSKSGSLRINSVSVSGANMSIFAGLREDPFFFDVTQFFFIRGFLASGGDSSLPGPFQRDTGGSAGNVFRSDATAVDFAAGYNVNSIVARVPISYLGGRIFDVWETISIPQ